MTLAPKTSDRYPPLIRTLSWVILAAPLIASATYFWRLQPDAGSRSHFYWVNSSVLIAAIVLFIMEKKWLSLTELRLRKWIYYGLILAAIFIPIGPVISIPIVSLIFGLPYVFALAPMSILVVPVIVIGCFFGAHPVIADGRFSPAFLAGTGGFWNFWYVSHWT